MSASDIHDKPHIDKILAGSGLQPQVMASARTRSITSIVGMMTL
ncbi:MAG: hypothetical protein ACMZI2_07335 (plasmid) [Candidatus Symbiodolus clandestinus]